MLRNMEAGFLTQHGRAPRGSAGPGTKEAPHTEHAGRSTVSTWSRGDTKKQEILHEYSSQGMGGARWCRCKHCRIIHSGRTVNGGHKSLKNYKQENSDFTGESLAVTTSPREKSVSP